MVAWGGGRGFSTEAEAAAPLSVRPSSHSTRIADEAAAKLAHDRVLLHSRGGDGDLTAHRPVTALTHRRQETPQRRQIRKVAHGTTEGGTPRLVLPPDVVHRLARNRDPAARFAGDLDHASRVRVGFAIIPVEVFVGPGA
jgi:hypothetical protein